MIALRTEREKELSSLTQPPTPTFHQQVKFGWVVKDDNAGGIRYTLSFQGPNTAPPGCAFI